MHFWCHIATEHAEVVSPSTSGRADNVSVLGSFQNKFRRKSSDTEYSTAKTDTGFTHFQEAK